MITKKSKRLFQETISWNVRDELQNLPETEVKQAQSRYPFGMAAFNVEGELNLGIMIRTAVIFCADRFYIIGKKKYDKRSTVGGHHYIAIKKIREDDLYSELTQDGFYPVFIEQGGAPFNPSEIYRDSLYYGYNPCFVFGSETEGIPKHLLPLNNTNVFSIYQPGVLRSLNVSTTAGIVAHAYSNFLRSN